MKNVIGFLVIVVIVCFSSSCEKCYKCHNVCKRCSYQYADTSLSISVCSDRLSEKYYLEYIDSLTSPSLGWTCVDALSDYQESFCEGGSKGAASLINKKDEGLICVEE